MKATFPKQALGPLAAVGAVVSLGLAWMVAGSEVTRISLAPELFVGLLLIALVALAHQFPLHLPDHKKMWFTSAPLLVMAALLPPALAVTGIGLAILCGELLTRSQRGTYLSDISAQAARWTVIALAATLVAHVPMGYHQVPLILAAATMWAGDIVTLPVVMAPVSSNSPVRIIRDFLREGAALEAAQYLAGLAILLALSGSLAALVLVPATIVTSYLACLGWSALSTAGLLANLRGLRPRMSTVIAR